MDENLLAQVKSLLSQNYSPDEVKSRLTKQGLHELNAEQLVAKAVSQLKIVREDSDKSFVKKLVWKEVLDRVGYGFVSNPFVNILFSLSGASYFTIGLVNGLRMIFSMIYSSFLKEFSKVQKLSKNFISNAGILYGFSFLVMSFAVVLKSPFIYTLAFLIGGLGVVAHGELYSNFLKSNIKREHRAGLAKISKYGILITIVSLLFSGYVIEFFSIKGKEVAFSLFGSSFNFNVYGYLISFEVTAFAFIFSGLLFSYVKQKKPVIQKTMSSFIRDFFASIKVHKHLFFKNKAVLLLGISSLIMGLVQTLGNSFYGIFIYNTFEKHFFGGFLNVAVVFSVAAVCSLFGPWFTRTLHRHLGISPMLVFGTLLSAMLPLSLAYNPNFVVVIMASAFSIIGASILGMAQSFFAKKLFSEEQRKTYFSFIGVILAFPLLFLIPLGAFFAQQSIVFLFKIIILLLVFVVAPIYLAIVILYERKSFIS
ncbi:hypothetical protein CMO90_01850 [Candidatus Woesearchaeota archaeon]|jgi:hypothetical protein|nr:hypothetical protein [Candidatus Woesearchaeota archaeon]|tara:strand:- start:2890 stop:4329 length:1440 start_codon:yes stop_codon:yes gene_type:complete